jgi:hypothetical protein
MIYPVEPVHTLLIHVRERTECSTKQEIPFYIPDRVFDLSFGLGIVRFAESGYEAIITEKVIELRIPRVIFGGYRPLDDYLFDVVIEDLPSISPEVVKRVVVALDEGIHICGKRKFRISHTGIAKYDAEAVYFSYAVILIDVVTFSPVNLSLDSGFCLIPEHCRCSFRGSNLAYVVLDCRVMPSEPLILNLSKYPSCTEWIFCDSLLDVILERVKYARLISSFHRCR